MKELSHQYLKLVKLFQFIKGDSQLNCSNYRPISLLSSTDKILESIMYNCLYKFLEINNLIYSLQFGFRQKHCTSHALIHLTHLREIENNWLSSYIQNRTQFVSINDFDSDVNAICCGVLQGSIPGPLKKKISILL